MCENNVNIFIMPIFESFLAKTAGNAVAGLQNDKDSCIIKIIYDNPYRSSSPMAGMKKEIKMQQITTYHSPLGKIILSEKAGALTGLWFEGQKYFMDSLKEELEECEDSPIFRQVRQWLDRYFAGEKPSAEALKLALPGSEFRRRVWKILSEIPYGEVTTYGAIAQRIAFGQGLEKMSAQAVGQAVSHNPVSIIIPCHRVVGGNGSLTGYAGGIEKKIKLLTLEGVDMGGLFVPKKGTAL